MKKTVSLLVTFLMVMSIGMLPSYASTDADLAVNMEESLPEGTLVSNIGDATGFTGSQVNLETAADSQKAAYKKEAGVTVIDDDGNKMFKLAADTTGVWFDHKLDMRLLSSEASAAGPLRRYTARVQLPAAESTSARTTLFSFNSSWYSSNEDNNGLNVNHANGFGVKLENGRAYYYDKQTGEYVNFLDSGNSIEPEKWYTVEAILDNRNSPGEMYMYASVYDENAGTYIGKSGWQLVSTPTEVGTSRVVQISASGYDVDDYVLIDSFNAYKIENAPTYAISDAENPTVYETNKYITAQTTNLWYRTVGERFNNNGTGNQNITSGSAYKAARYEMSFRIPSFETTAEYDLIGFLSGASMLVSNTAGAYKGMAVVTQNGEFKAKSVDGSSVNLTDGTSYQLAANTWYNLVIEVDYSTFAAPVAKLYLKDSAGNILTQSAEYTVSQMTVGSYDQTVIMWSGISAIGSAIHFDNTKASVAATKEALLSNTDVKTVIDEDFEVYDGANASYYEENAAYASLVGTQHVSSSATTVASQCTTAAVAAERTIISGIDFKDGITLPKTDDTILKAAYTSPIPAEFVNKDNIKVFENGEELTGETAYDVEPGAEDVNGNVLSFNILLSGLKPFTTYTLRLASGLSDYNATAASNAGVPADAGFYKDYTFYTPADPLAASLDTASFAAVGGGEIVAGSSVEASITLNNSSSRQREYMLVITSWNEDNECVAIKNLHGYLEAGQSESLTLPAVTYEDSGSVLRLSLLNNWYDMTPVGAAVICP